MQIRRAFVLTPLVSAWIALGACGVPRSVAVPDGDGGDAAEASDDGSEAGFEPRDAAALLDAPAVDWLPSPARRVRRGRDLRVRARRARPRLRVRAVVRADAGARVVTRTANLP